MRHTAYYQTLCENNDGETPLHLASADHSRAHFVQYLLSTGMDPLAKDKNGKTPMIKQEYIYGSLKLFRWGEWRHTLVHLAAHHGWMDVIIDLITKYKCDPNCKDSRGNTPLHYASHLEVVRYFINEQLCDPMTKNNDDETPLHLACRYCNDDIVQYLLSTGKVDPLAKNKCGQSPVDIASKQANSYDLLQLFLQCERDFPVHTYTKLVLTGYSGAGKTTISRLILLLATCSKATGFFSWLSSGRVTKMSLPARMKSAASKHGSNSVVTKLSFCG